jgi:hypothetical protein
MNTGALTAILAVVAVALIGLFMRRSAGGGVSAGTAGPDSGNTRVMDEPDELDEPDRDDGDGAEAEPVAMTSDGWTFVPVADRQRVRLYPPFRQDPLGPPMAPPKPEQLVHGDLTAARIARGAPDHDPWRLEALGMDGEFRAWRFETREAAEAALALVIRCIVRTPQDEDGTLAPATDAEFAAARRLEEEIERELAAMPDVGEPPEER